MAKSSIDELFFELYGYYPPKAGQAYEMLVAAAFKLLLDKDVTYDQRIRGAYSNTVYQLDGYIEDDAVKNMVEAKDYTIDDRKVGRDDLQKLQGALSDLPLDKGIFASATDYTAPARKYANSSVLNPLHKEIELFHIRPSTDEDEEGRIKRIVIEMSMHVPEYTHGSYQPVWTEEAKRQLQDDGLAGKPVKLLIEKFYDSKGGVIMTLEELTRNASPQTNWEKGFVAKATWIIIGGYLEVENKLYSIKGVTYSIPFSVSNQEIVIEGDGHPKMFIKSETGEINKLITDEQLKRVKFENGKVVL